MVAQRCYTTNRKLSARSIDLEGGQRLVFDIKWEKSIFRYVLCELNENMEFVTLNRHETGQIWSYRGVSTTNRQLSSIDLEGGQRLVFDIKWAKLDFPLIIGRFFEEKNKKWG